jgi:hypothetical protein
MLKVCDISVSSKFARYANEVKADGGTIGYMNFVCSFNEPVHILDRLFASTFRMSVRESDRSAPIKQIEFRKPHLNFEDLDEEGEYKEFLTDPYEDQSLDEEENLDVQESKSIGNVCGRVVYFPPFKVDDRTITDIHISLFVKRKVYDDIRQLRDSINLFRFSCVGSLRQYPPEDYAWDGEELSIIGFKYEIFHFKNTPLQD